MLTGFFVCVLSLYTVASWTISSRTFLSQALAFFCFIGLLLFPWRFYQGFLRIGPFEAFLFNVMGAGPLLFSLLLWVNFLFHGPPVEEVHGIEDRKGLRNILNPAIEFQLEEDAYADRPEFRRFVLPPDQEEQKHLQEADRIMYRTAEGALGHRVMVERRVLR